MSASNSLPAVGDRVFIYDGINEGIFNVIQISNDQIYIESVQNSGEISLLYLTPQGWKAHGTDTLYQIYFQTPIDVTPPPWRISPSVITSPVSLPNYPSQPSVERAPEGTVYGEGCVTSLVGRANEDRYVSGLINNQVRFYMVFDGHGGNQTVNLLQDEFPDKLAKALFGVDLQNLTEVEQAVQKAIDEFEAEVLRPQGPEDGSTMVLALITDLYIYFVNLGDSRGILFNNSGKIISETIDHDPNNEIERIQDAGSFVVRGRVMGLLAVSRGFGDFDYKEINEEYSNRGPVSLQADITQDIRIPPDPQLEPTYLLLASDGLFEQISRQLSEPTNQDIINEIISQGEENILNSCSRIADRARQRATDDITVMIIEI